MRKVAAILVCLLLLLSVGVAYSKCGQAGCGGGGSCSAAEASGASCPEGQTACAAKAACDGDCASCEGPASACADCDGTSCAQKDCDKVASISGTVRYVRSTNSAVKVATADKAVLLRINTQCTQSSGLKTKLAALAKGDAVTAKYYTCPESGKHYLVDISGGATAAESAATTPAGCPSTGGCGGGGCGGQ
jgi:hypothetical protein